MLEISSRSSFFNLLHYVLGFDCLPDFALTRFQKGSLWQRYRPDSKHNIELESNFDEKENDKEAHFDKICRHLELILYRC